MAKDSPAVCAIYKKCGGCQLQNLEYQEQLAYKQAQVRRLLGGYGRVSPIIGMDDPLHYRSKVQTAFFFSGGKILSGVYQSASHRVVPTDGCMLEDVHAAPIIKTIKRLMPAFKLTAYDMRSGRGMLRHVLIRRGHAGGEIMVVLVLKTPVFPAKKAFAAALCKARPEITTVIMNVNDTATELFLGEHEEVLYGAGTIEDSIMGCRFRISARSFYQVNPVQTQVLYKTAIDFAELTGRETVIDAYCGIGTIGLSAAHRAGRVIGIEVNRDAVRDAKENAVLNGIENAEFYAGDAGRIMEEMAQENFRADTVFMDPPRAGAGIKFLESVKKLAPRRIVYISCEIETQARDLRRLTGVYEVEKIQPVDMFPYTRHIECVVSLKRKEEYKR